MWEWGRRIDSGVPVISTTRKEMRQIKKELMRQPNTRSKYNKKIWSLANTFILKQWHMSLKGLAIKYKTLMKPNKQDKKP